MAYVNQRAWDALLDMERPPYLYDWHADREDIAQARQRLNAGASALGPQHPVANELLTCVRRIDEWLGRTSGLTGEQAERMAIDEYNLVIVPELQSAGRRIRPALASMQPST
ncbi:MAG: hypothetical protein GEU98_26635 [Pseudonocardiaceae bacterium]|nr:hypothetical protein [Pseudonocardiaceae bacterium]